MEWVMSTPEVPEAECKDFGTFKLVGRGPLPGTFLEREQPCYGKRI